MTQTALQRSEERFKLLVESIQDYAIFMLDPGGRIVSWNVGAERLKGYTADEIIGKSFEVFYPEEARRVGHPQHELALAARDGRYAEEGWRIRKDGSRFWADVTITALRDSEGALTGFGKVTRDLSERRRADEALRTSEERFRLLVEPIQDYAIFMLDPRGRVATWNLGAERLKGFEPDEIIGTHFSIFYPAEAVQAGHPEHELEVARREGRYAEEGWRLRKDGERFWADVTITALRDRTGDLTGYAKVTRDLTERRRAEEILRLQEAVRMRDEFLSIASHELRTPLAALHLQLDAILRALGGETEGGREKSLRKLKMATRQVDRLTALVEGLLSLSRIATGRFGLELEELDVVALAQELFDRYEEEADRARCQLVLRAPPSATGHWDKVRLDQALTNVLANALKYGAGKPIEVTIWADPEHVRVAVRDEGIGVAQQDLQRIFGRFERAVSPSHYGGLGLGLHVASEIVAAHGGTIEATSQPGKGATFTIVLPRQPPRPSSEPSP